MSIIIDFDQLAAECLSRCEELATHTDTPGQLTRLFLTPAMLGAHQCVSDWMRQAGLTVRTDGAGNLIGSRPPSTIHSKTLIIGSHLDTVPNAGRYDGMLGVVAAIAAVKAIGHAKLPFAIDVIGFSEEEGVRYSTPYLGSRAIAGTFDINWLSTTDTQGVFMVKAIEDFGLSAADLCSTAYSPDRVLGFVEAHIEQGPVLARLNLPVAAVDAIAGQSRLKMVFVGQSGHAGTTPMVPRADALVCAARFIVAVSDHGRNVEGLRATVGFIDSRPNARNVIPSEVTLSLDVRHADDRVRRDAVGKLCDLASGFASSDGVAFAITQTEDQSASAMDPCLTEKMQLAIASTGLPKFSMLSGAGHDAVAMAQRFPTAMLFIRQPSGISHHPDEDVERADVAVAIEVLARFVCELAADSGGVDDLSNSLRSMGSTGFQS